LLALATLAVVIAALAWWTHDAPPVAGELVVTDPPSSEPGVLRLVTMNIRRGRGMDDRTDLSRTTLTLRGGDIVGLQEVGHGQPEELATRLGLSSLFAPTERRWFRDDFGNAILSRYPATWQSIPLPRSSGQPARNVVLAHVRVGDWTVRVLVAHVGRHQDNAPQLARLRELFLSLEPPAVLMGDLNAHAGTPQLEAIRSTSGVTDVLAGRVEDDPRRVTWMFVRGLTVKDAWLSDDRASDHPALFAEVMPTR
jgi:endonuclease/exonuclease/phosphatase family metal-dependent hydrolase